MGNILTSLNKTIIVSTLITILFLFYFLQMEEILMFIFGNFFLDIFMFSCQHNVDRITLVL